MARGILWITVHPNLKFRPFYNTVAHNHVTLKFNVDSEDYKDVIGREVDVYVSDRCWNDNVEALRVILDPEMTQLCNNEHPHITLSVAPNVAPVESNDMLAAEHNSRVIGKVLRGTVEFFTFPKR